MLPPNVSAGITTRLREVQEVLSHLRRIEAAPGQPEGPEVRLLRGLFYVHLYGAFEYGINSIVSAAAQVINGAAVPHNQLIDSIGAIVLNAQFNAVGQASPQNQWSKRLGLIERRASPHIASIDDGAIDLQNIWLKTIEQLFAVFGILKPAMYDVTKSGYVFELTDTRNKIAHGRESPIDIGRRRRASELQLLYDSISLEIFYFLDSFDDYLKNAEYKV